MSKDQFFGGVAIQGDDAAVSVGRGRVERSKFQRVRNEGSEGLIVVVAVRVGGG